MLTLSALRVQSAGWLVILIVILVIYNPPHADPLLGRDPKDPRPPRVRPRDYRGGRFLRTRDLRLIE